MGQKQSIEDAVLDMKLKSKEMKRLSDRCYKEAKAEKLKVKNALEQNNPDNAKLFAENTIRKENEGLNCLKLSSKLDTVATRLATASRSQEMNKSVYQAVPKLSKAMATLDLNKLTDSMMQFEQMFENLDIQTDYVTSTVDSTNATTTPPDQVSALINQVADEHALDISGMMNTIPHAKVEQSTGISDVERRLERL